VWRLTTSLEDLMSVVTPLPRDKSASEVHGIYNTLSKKFGKMPNMFGLMAQRPDVLRKFLQFESAVMEGGTVEPRYKELAYPKKSLINGCEY
jgi:alkylhydroperoxidase family enzyme